MSTANVSSFKFTISGECYAPEPDLLGRDNPYTLNVKLLDKDGVAVSGVKYSITSDNDGAHLLNIEGMDKSYTSLESGNSFYIEGLPATQEADLAKMQYEFFIDCETEDKTVTGKHSFRMGRLLRWGRPGISVKTGPDKAVFSTKTERVSKESPGAKWDWGESIVTCNIKIGDAIDGAGVTSLTEGKDGSFKAAPEIELSKFASLSKSKIQFEGGKSNDGFTAVLP